MPFYRNKTKSLFFRELHPLKYVKSSEAICKLEKTMKKSKFPIFLTAVILSIIGLFILIQIPKIRTRNAGQNVLIANAQLQYLHEAVKNYHTDTDEYPQSLNDIIVTPCLMLSCLC